ncbi:hypothetical protein GCM10008107_14530 [Psychrosphaera saromensis]|uniref:Uncharacterized protein n=1 Tax=Psychrosphaera saromensis TaxID=716813 RepID=A0A2S7UUA5_9GAMM|nr:hypothetical protein [Psychrosphaera saromensis]PQJ53319.1 hypothetical protein BTO11_06320 [Psychrosphaera saromensis]GHB66426.1 hypothetical protein GCM10008107_14530 [Psychrosphaera saromensis]GLQ14909.1 hypothetical protein GCM10007917_23640 [Psychrosphaera saromensis]
MNKIDKTKEQKLMKKIRQSFIFYTVIGCSVISFFLLISIFTSSGASLLPYLFIIILLSLNYLFIKDCFAELLTLLQGDEK